MEMIGVGKMADMRIYRFHQRVAICLANGKTVYIDAKSARKLSRAVNRVCRSIERESFVDSNVGTFEAEFDDLRFD